MVDGVDHADAAVLSGVADYTFTDQELTDILGYMESHDPLSTSPPFVTAPGNFQALQFLPRSHTPLAPHPTLDFPSTSAAGPAAVKSEPIVVRDYKGEMSGIPLPEPSHTRQGGSYTPRISTRSGQNGHKGDLPSGRKQSTRKISHARSGSGEYRHGHISHSTVEKQRRDRINALIDELRELVPSQADGPPQDASMESSKRPKHVVLSDTIALVKDLQIRVRDTPPQSCTVSGDCEEEGSPVDADAGAATPRKPSDAADAPAEHQERSSDQDSEPPQSPLALPQALSDGSNAAPGVTVEEGENGLFVKVNCKDRRGLLSDIIMALKSMPLEITTAAVTTGQDGFIHDVFQVKLDPKSGITAEAVRDHVVASLHGLEGLGDKRRRTEET